MVSKSALVVFRLLERLSRDTGYGYVCVFDRLVGMVRYCERRLWQLVKELIEAGWIAWKVIREKGRRGIQFWPLVVVPEPAPGLFGHLPNPTFFASKVAPSIAPSTEKTCTLAERKPLMTIPVGNKTTREDVRVVPPSPEPPDPQAVALAVAAGVPEPIARKVVAGKPVSAVRRALQVIEQYRAKNAIRNLTAFLRSALQHGWEPRVPAADHPSDRGERVYRYVTAPPDFVQETSNEPRESLEARHAWDALSEAERRALRQSALAEILAQGTAAERKQVRKYGIDSMWVTIRAKRLARQQESPNQEKELEGLRTNHGT